MKWFVLSLAIIAVMLAVFLFSNASEKTAEGFIKRPHYAELNLNLSTDKKVYHSSEEMELTAVVETSGRLENVTIRVYGIKDRRGNFRIDAKREVNIEPPGTKETFVFRMPSCYGCAGVSPGKYNLTVEVSKDGKVLGNFSKEVKLEK